MQAWLDTLSAGAARSARAVFRTIMNRAEDLEYVDHHPLNKRYIMPTKKLHPRETSVFSPDELDEIFEECKGQPFEAAFILAAFGGGQRAEVLGVKPVEIEFLEREDGVWAVAPVKRGVHHVPGGAEVTERAKNAYREAALIIPPPYAARLQDIAQDCDEWLTDDGFGAPMDPEVLRRTWQKWLGSTAHRYVPFGNLRNLYSTMLHSLGLEDSTVSKLMRHANLTTDYKHYNRLGAEDLIALIEKGFKN